jgi:hypothetical protein
MGERVKGLFFQLRKRLCPLSRAQSSSDQPEEFYFFLAAFFLPPFFLDDFFALVAMLSISMSS